MINMSTYFQARIWIIGNSMPTTHNPKEGFWISSLNNQKKLQTDFEKIHPNCIGGADYVIHSKKSTNNLSQTRSVARALICTNHIKKTMFTFHVPFFTIKTTFFAWYTKSKWTNNCRPSFCNVPFSQIYLHNLIQQIKPWNNKTIYETKITHK